MEGTARVAGGVFRLPHGAWRCPLGTVFHPNQRGPLGAVPPVASVGVTNPCALSAAWRKITEPAVWRAAELVRPAWAWRPGRGTCA